MQGTPISLPLPLADFAKAYDGPATDPKVFEEQQRKLQEELQKKAEDARKKLEGQQPGAGSAGTGGGTGASSSCAEEISATLNNAKGAARGRAFSFGTVQRAPSALTVARPVAAARILLEHLATSGWRIGLSDVSGNKFCSET